MKKIIIFIFISFFLFSCSPSKKDKDYESPQELSAASQDNLGRDVKKWSEAFPLQAQSNQKNLEMSPSPTGYGGSIPFERWDLVPSLKTNFMGIAFSKDYKEDRGHIYAWEDVFETKRTSEKSPAACISCKTSDIELIFDEYGWDYASMKMYDFEESGHAGIDCFSCHDPESKKLRPIGPAFLEAIAAQGVDIKSASEKEMRTYVCAQCHSEYYFEPKTKRVIHPWAEGLDPDQMYAYYETEPGGFKQDYINPISQSSMLKAQHPDYEIFQSGIHASAGLSCADCHMPKTEVKNASGEFETITQHWITSPLKTINTSCLNCHVGKNEQWILERVAYIQDSVYQGLNQAGDAIEQAHFTFEKAIEEGKSTTQLKEAEGLLREAQWYWDLMASENSGGFHNSELVLSYLNKSIDLAYKAILKAQS